MWLNGYTQWVSGGEVKSDIVRFLFFSANNNEEFEINNYPSGVTEYYEYIKLEEDKTYTQLLDKGELNLKSGKIVKLVLDTSTSSNGKTKEITLPVGKYFVVAFYYERGYRRDFWNKYATTYYILESGYNPKTLDVVIPDYYNQCGSIDWTKWAYSPVEF